MSATPDSTLADCEQLVADLRRQLAEGRAEPDEALEYQTATSDVLNVIQFRSLAEPWADTSTSTGRLMIAVLGGRADVRPVC